MKNKLLKLALFVGIPVVLFAASARIKDFATTATSPAGDDYIALDGTTNGTRKILGVRFLTNASVTGTGNVVHDTSPTFPGNFTITGNATPSTGAAGAISFDTNAWAASRGSLQVYDGTANIILLGALASDAPSDGQVPRWNTGGTITWEDAASGSGNITGPTMTANAVVVGAGTTAIAPLASLGTSGAPLLSAGAGAPPAFGALNLAGGSNIVTGDLPLADGGTGASLTDPNADRLMFWDDSAGAVAFLTAGTGLTITGTTIEATAGSGNITGPGTSAANAIVTWNSTGGTSVLHNTNLTAVGNVITSTGNLSLASATNQNIVLAPAGTGITTMTGAGNTTGNFTVGDSLIVTNNATFGNLITTDLTISGSITGTIGTANGGLGADNSAASGIPVFSAGTATVTATTGTGAPVRATSPQLTTSVTTDSTTFALLNTTATTVNAFGAATTLNIGASATTVLNLGGSTSAAELRFLEPSGSGTNYTALKVGAQTANVTYTLPAAVGAAGTFLKDAAGDGVLSWASPSGAGTVTNTGGSLTANAVVLGAGTDDTKVVAGIITDGASAITLGVNESLGGSVKLFGSTSGNVTVAPTAAAGAGVTLTLPAATDTLVGKATTDTLTNKTFDASATGNALKQYGYLVLSHPAVFGSGVTQQTTVTSPLYGQALFSNSADKATNYIEYVALVPPDIDTAVALTGRFTFILGGADTGDHEYEISMIDVAASAVYDGAPADAISLTYTADGSGADKDVEYAGAPDSLTGWAAALAAGQYIRIRVARDGDHANDGSTVNSYSGPLVIRYGSTQ